VAVIFTTATAKKSITARVFGVLVAVVAVLSTSRQNFETLDAKRKDEKIIVVCANEHKNTATTATNQ
jgi:rhodanese-related sulfurtransferase